MKPSFPTLAVLTAICLLLLVPYFASDWYLPALRDAAFYPHQFFRRGAYKLITGYIGLAFFLLQMVLTLRKRGRRWKIKLPGSMMFWRSLHIFLGVGFIGMSAIHTIGATGGAFNQAFLVVFVMLSLVAMLGVVMETRFVGISAREVALVPGVNALRFPKGALIRNLRQVWLGLHIILVSAFGVMLGFHIFLAHYFR